MISKNEFVVGQHNIGYVDSEFKHNFGEVEFSEKKLGTFQKLPHYMTDSQIESELKPGTCELGDVFAFIKNAPEECKDGKYNLFYFSSFVVSVVWVGGGWRVVAWFRVDVAWRGGLRVFSPATVTGNTVASNTVTLEPSVSKKMEYRINVESVDESFKYKNSFNKIIHLSDVQLSSLINELSDIEKDL